MTKLQKTKNKKRATVFRLRIKGRVTLLKKKRICLHLILAIRSLFYLI